MEYEGDRPLIEFADADISNGEITIIGGLDLRIKEGAFVYLTGRVGSGKTSIIRTITGENPVTGRVARVLDFDLLRLKRRQIPYLRRHLGIVFQDFQLLEERSVEDNLQFILKATGCRKGAERRERIAEVLEEVSLTSKAHKMPHQLSGGEQQRVAIARALLNRPRIILADEPTGNLDGESARRIMELLQKINRETGTAVLMVTHNTRLITEYPGRVLLCSGNTCTEVMPPKPAAETTAAEPPAAAPPEIPAPGANPFEFEEDLDGAFEAETWPGAPEPDIFS